MQISIGVGGNRLLGLAPIAFGSLGPEAVQSASQVRLAPSTYAAPETLALGAAHLVGGSLCELNRASAVRAGRARAARTYVKSHRVSSGHPATWAALNSFDNNRERPKLGLSVSVLVRELEIAAGQPASM